MILRIYDPHECDAHGVPLDWERCRTCHGVGKLSTLGIDIGVEVVTRAVMEALLPCSSCGGHGSLKAAALAHWRMSVTVTHTLTADEPMVAEGVIAGALPRAVRCEDCGHPMSEGTWEPLEGVDGPRLLRMAEYAAKYEPDGVAAVEVPGVYVHYSPCDEGCRHGGPGRCWYPGGEPHWDYYDDLDSDAREDTRANGFGSGEASWRPVDVRTLGWPHDLRPEKLAVLCLRCWARHGFRCEACMGTGRVIDMVNRENAGQPHLQQPRLAERPCGRCGGRGSRAAR